MVDQKFETLALVRVEENIMRVKEETPTDIPMSGTGIERSEHVKSEKEERKEKIAADHLMSTGEDAGE